jgi:hypothetical protein
MVGGETYVNLPYKAAGDVPPGVITVTFTSPVPAGVVAVISVALFTVNVASVVPNFTVVAPVKFSPVIVTVVPPPVVPDEGEIIVTDGVGKYVKSSTETFSDAPP